MDNIRQTARLAMLTLPLPLASLTACMTPAQENAASATYEGKPVALGKGSARTVVRTDASGKPTSIGVVLSEAALEGLPTAPPGTQPNFPYELPMPERGPRTVVDHVVVNWEVAGHPPPKVYDVPHFDFHFYLVGRAEREKVHFQHGDESGQPGQQPPAELLPAGYIVPPGTAVPQMGVHAVHPGAPEFNGQPFTATFIYGYHDKRQTFLEPMVTLAYLKSKPAFSAPVPRPASYLKAGVYPSSYRVRYDPAGRNYEVSLEGLR